MPKNKQTQVETGSAVTLKEDLSGRVTPASTATHTTLSSGARAGWPRSWRSGVQAARKLQGMTLERKEPKHKLSARPWLTPKPQAGQGSKALHGRWQEAEDAG